jgi:hypothetical protein
MTPNRRSLSERDGFSSSWLLMAVWAGSRERVWHPTYATTSTTNAATTKIMTR